MLFVHLCRMCTTQTRVGFQTEFTVYVIWLNTTLKKQKNGQAKTNSLPGFWSGTCSVKYGFCLGVFNNVNAKSHICPRV